jgi:hypothetical protein
MLPYAFVKVNTTRVNLILVEHSDIDWIDKEIKEESEYLELIYPTKKNIDVFNLRLNKHEVIKVKDLKPELHRLLFNDKTYVVMHIL